MRLGIGVLPLVLLKIVYLCTGVVTVCALVRLLPAVDMLVLLKMTSLTE